MASAPSFSNVEPRVAAYYTTGLWYDVGTITSYERLNSELRDYALSFIKGQSASHP